jgi:hypothetical protein
VKRKEVISCGGGQELSWLGLWNGSTWRRKSRVSQQSLEEGLLPVLRAGSHFPHPHYFIHHRADTYLHEDGWLFSSSLQPAACFAFRSMVGSTGETQLQGGEKGAAWGTDTGPCCWQASPSFPTRLWQRTQGADAPVSS